MRKISMKRKSRTPNSETSDVVDDEKSGDENAASEEQDTPETTNGSHSKKNKKNKRASKNANEENGTEKKSKKGKETVESKEDEQYEVEQVLDDKMVKGVRHFLIRWKGYEEDSDTWEPESTLSCPDLISKYLDSKDTQTPSKSSKRKSMSMKKKKSDNSDDEGPGGEYEVDKILEVYHKRNGKREFLVHWKGYSQADNTWEPEDNMNCPDLIDRFMTRVEKAKSVETRELRVKRQRTERFTLNMIQHGRKLSRRNQGRQRVQYHDSE